MKITYLLFLLALAISSCTNKELKVEYTHLTPTEFRERMAVAPVAYLPLGTIEWHGEHLPLGADGLQSSAFFIQLAQKAGGIVLPMVFLGPDAKLEEHGKTYYGMDFWFDPGSMKKAPIPSNLDGSAYWVSDSLFVQLMEATLLNLSKAGFKLVVAHGHGPSTNQFNQHLAAWETKYNMKLMTCWFENNSDSTGIMCDHAAMNETSLIQHYYPQLVKMHQLPKGKEADLRGIAGKDPRSFASAKLGKRIVCANLERMTQLIKNELNDNQPE
jgi:creatinine amidohydrolase